MTLRHREFLLRLLVRKTCLSTRLKKCSGKKPPMYDESARSTTEQAVTKKANSIFICVSALCLWRLRERWIYPDPCDVRIWADRHFEHVVVARPSVVIVDGFTCQGHFHSAMGDYLNNFDGASRFGLRRRETRSCRCYCQETDSLCKRIVQPEVDVFMVYGRGSRERRHVGFVFPLSTSWCELVLGRGTFGVYVGRIKPGEGIAISTCRCRSRKFSLVLCSP